MCYKKFPSKPVFTFYTSTPLKFIEGRFLPCMSHKYVTKNEIKCYVPNSWQLPEMLRNLHLTANCIIKWAQENFCMKYYWAVSGSFVSIQICHISNAQTCDSVILCAIHGEWERYACMPPIPSCVCDWASGLSLYATLCVKSTWC